MVEWKKHIVSDKNILLGKPTIKGTRITVDHITGLLAQGWNEKQVLDNYPRLTKKDIQAIFYYINECLKDGLFCELTKQSA
jgi:uncharacterized protein (DUF433 family)